MSQPASRRFSPGAAAGNAPEPDIEVEVLGLAQLAALRGAWAALSEAAIEPNVFLSPGFALPLFQHAPGGEKRRFLVVWSRRTAASAGQMIGLLPLACSGFLAKSPTHKHAPLGSPLLDRERAEEALAAVHAWLVRHTRAAGLMLAFLPVRGPVFALLQAEAASRGGLTILDAQARAALIARRGDETLPAPALSAKRRKAYRQQRQKLERSGRLAYRSIRAPEALAAAADDFLELESRGWKGARKTALLKSPSEAGFFRAMIMALGAEGACRVDSLDLDGSSIAMGVVLRSGATAYFWKTAYDEAFAPFSPGVQLTLELTKTQQACASLRLTDSCAVPNHPMIDHLWKDRIELADVIVPLASSGSLAFKSSVALAVAKRRIRALCKAAFNRFRRRGSHL